MKLLGNTKILMNKTKNRQNVPKHKVVEVVLVQCNLLDNQYKQNFAVLYNFTPNKSYTYLLNVEPSNLVFWKTYNTEFDQIIIAFVDQNGRSLKFEYKVNFKLLINK